MVKQVNTAQFDELLKGKKPVVCDFFATWCGPCRALGPVIEEVSEDFSDKAIFVKVDVDENEELARRYEIRSIPFVCIFNGGKLIDSFLGYIPAESIKTFLSKNL